MQFTKTYTVRSSEIDYKYRLKPFYAISMFLDAFALYCDDNGVAAYHLHEIGKSWVMTELKVLFAKDMPVWKDELSMKVWVRKVLGVRVIGDFFLYDKKGDVVCRGTSRWLILDIESRTPDTADCVRNVFDICKEEAIPGFRFGAIEPFFGKQFIDKQLVRSFDIDFNKHLNSVRYIAGAIESIPLELRENTHLKEIYINYIKEAFLGETITSIATGEHQNFYHQQFRDSEPHEICKMHSQWFD
ncbi:MAG: thioesterase [Bacteroidales bacterium]|nr:thioesterase [Bacteroidales bacterium]